MRAFGYKLCFDLTATVRGLLRGLICLGVAVPCLHAQNAPYLLPYTLSTYAGANGQYASTSFGTVCIGGYVQDASGDGCVAKLTSINGEPHDVRVDPRGNVFYIDNTTTTSGVIHKINPYNLLSTIYVGNGTSCASSTTSTTSKYGDSCQANDGVANNTTTKYTPILKAIRGLSAAATGDLGIAGYNDYFVHDVIASTGIMKLIAGTGATGTTNGAPDTSAINQSRGIGFDPTGNIAYVADTGNNTLRQIVNVGTGPTASILTTTLTATSGTAGVTSNVPASGALLAGPEDVQTDSYGNIYIADFNNHVIRAIYVAGTLPWFTSAAAPSAPQAGYIYTIAGVVSSGQGVASVTGFPATTPATTPVYLYPIDGSTPTVSPTSVAIGVRKLGIDAQNNLYLADSAWNVVWFLDHATGQMRLLAGRYGTFNATAPGQPSLGCAANPNTGQSVTNVGDGCPGPDGQFFGDSDLAVSPDRFGNLYVTDAENNTGAPASAARIRKLLTGTVFPATLTNASVTQNLLVHFGPGDTPAATSPFTVTGDYTVAGSTCTVNADTTDDCVVSVKFAPTHAGADTATLTATSTAKATASFVLTGSGTAPTVVYDPGNIATLTSTTTAAQGVALDGAGNAYVADTTNNQILYVSVSGATTTLVPASAGLKSPSAVALGVDGSVYIADTGNNLIRKYSATGTLTTYGGGATGTCAAPSDSFNDNCLATQASFKAPAGLATDTLGNLYVADTGNNVIRVIASNGFVSAFAGGATSVCSTNTDTFGDGCGAAGTKFSAPTGLAFDPIGNSLYVADTGEHRVRKIFLSTTFQPTATGATDKDSSILINPVTAVAGTGATGSTVDSSGIAAKSALTSPTGVAVDASGTVYIADTGNGAIRMVTPSNGIISTIAGSLGTPGDGAAGSAAAITASGYTTTCSTNLTTVTLTAANSFTAGLGVTFSGLTNATFLNGQNLSVLAAGLSATQFQVNVPGLLSCPPGTVGTTYTSASSAETGTASFSTSATSTGLKSPSAVAVTPTGDLVIADAGNSRLLLDSRSQVSYNFGPITVSNPATSSSPQPFTVTNIGNSAANLGNFTTNPGFTLTGAATSTGIAACTSNSSYAAGSICNVNAVFTPTTAGQQSATFTELTPVATTTPSITLSGDGAAALTSTSAAVIQTYPATGDPQFSGTFTVQATITASSCNAFAPSCSPTGSVQFTVDNATSGAAVSVSALKNPANSSVATTNLTGLTVGSHTIACSFKEDSFDNAYYAASSCPSINITIDKGGTSSVLSITAGSSNQQQYPLPLTATPPLPSCVYATTTANYNFPTYTCTDTTLTATVSATTAGTPTNSVNFYVTPLGKTNTITLASNVPVSTIGQKAVASLPLTYIVDSNGNLISDTTLPPGNYTLSCQYNGDSNYATSNCPGVTFNVLPEAPMLSLSPRACLPSSIYAAGTSTPQYGQPCGNVPAEINGLPTVAVGQGSTTDVTLFITPSNTVSGTLNFSCSGLPANSICTFSPQTLTVTASSTYTPPIYTDVTLWTDIPPGVTPSKAEMHLPGDTGNGPLFALMFGWPLSLLGFVGLLRFRRASRSRGLTLTALALLMVGSALTLSGCAGPGIYHPNLTPTGTYAVTITATGPNGLTSSTTVEFTVTPGLAGQQ